MDITDSVLLFLELVGTLAFSFSGAVVAIQRRLDIFGTLVLGVITAVGGGMIRDITLGVIPPMLFRRPVYVIVAAVTAAAVFALCYFRAEALEMVSGGIYSQLIGTMDSVGLGIFTVVGVSAAMQNGYANSSFLAVTVGVITGVGGGMIRDLLANRTPVVLHKQVYAVASLAGAVLYYWLLRLTSIPRFACMFIGAGIVILLRLLASHFRWDLPVVGKRGE